MHTKTHQPAASTACPVSRDFDPFGAVFQADPAHAMWEEGPVFFSERLGWWVVTRHADIRAVSSDTESFSSRNFSVPITPLCPAAVDKLAEYDYKAVGGLGSMDEPEHLVRRRAVAEPYKAKNTAEWEPRVREVQTQYIDRFVKRGHADLVADLFWEAPAVVAVEFMGIPQDDVTKVKDFAAGMLKFIFGHPTEDEQVETCDVIGRNYRYSREMVERLKRDPSGSGILQTAVRVHETNPDVIDEDLLVAMGIHTLTAAHETTSGSLANAMVLLLNNLDQWDALCGNPSLAPGAVEECLRLGPSLTTNRRFCVKDTVVGGVKIPAGAQLLLGVAAGNIDDSVFENPDEFDITRKNARSHFAFGYGVHACLGAPLARLQMKVAFEELSRRLPHMQLVPDQQLEYVPTSSARAPISLQVEWDPEKNPLREDRPLVA